MIQELDSRPPGVFDERLDDDHHWIRAFNADYVYCYLALKIEKEVAVVHLEMRRWNKTVLKEMLADWEKILYACRNAGATSLTAANPDYLDKRWPKLIKHFGFDEPEIISVSTQKI